MQDGKIIKILCHDMLDEDVSPFMYVGEVNGEGYVQWKAVEKDEVYDFRQIQDDLHFILIMTLKIILIHFGFWN